MRKNGEENIRQKVCESCFDPERMELVPAEGVILEISDEPGTMRVAADFGDSGEMEVVLRINYRLPKPSEYFEEGQRILLKRKRL